ncbi:hypothetical protein [Humibacter ginsenosidimutans]|uniref:Uncharacterized protein n=1 Tax=Humibacter ginsenosidimutans TaxID=2599293 RepID=A0A5B8M3A6_9MICO|nr:hypothetical protein [Humibacter ginsenosidimutans]QDZ14766.1 hypothetical protein FPZ11_08345 [Humibacter ginsenosidimutans]
MNTVIIDAGTLDFSGEDLTATGRLVPYGVESRSSLGTFTFSAGDIALPSDVTGMSLNVEHKRENVIGAFSRVWEQSDGVYSSFKFANTPAGRRAYQDAKSGKRKNLSAEVANVRIRGGKALPGAVLFAGAVVEHPAFDGATLLAADDTETSGHYESEYVDENGVTWRRVEDSTTTTSADGTSTTTETTVTNTVEEPDDNPAEPVEETDEEDPEEETIMANAAPGNVRPVASTLLAGAPTGNTPTKEPVVDLGSVFASMATIKAGTSNDPAYQDATTLLAALSDITVEKAGGLTGANSGILQPAWVGRLWQGRRYQRKYLDLLTHLYGGIQLGGRKGFKLAQGTALVTQWAGNKAAIGSGTASTSLTSSTRQAYGYAADIAQEWYDLEGGAEVLQAFFEGVVDSYAKITDEDALSSVFLAASKSAAALDRLVAPDTYPSVDGHDYEGAMGMVIQGIEAVYDADDTASFSIVNPAAWKQLLYTAKDLVPEYVSFGIGAGTGDANADGKVTIVKAADSFFAGLDATKPQVIVGAKAAIEFREQGETPIQIDALNIAQGGVDKAVIGYLETFVVRPESLVLVGTKSA